MQKDERFTTLGKLLKSNENVTLTDVLKILPKTTLAHALSLNPARFNRMIADARLFVVKDLEKLSELAEVDLMAVFRVINNSIPRKKRK